MCHCGKLIDFIDCCGAIHSGQRFVQTAEELMRSRYAAFVVHDGEYLSKSHHPEFRFTKKQIKETVLWSKSVEWLKLEILRTEKGLETDDFGIVEFNAFFLENGTIQCLHEVSTFLKLEGVWYYEKAL